MALARKKQLFDEMIHIRVPENLAGLIKGRSLYLELVSIFPLAPISNQNAHKAAVDMVMQLIKYLNSKKNRVAGEERAITSYVKMLSFLIENYEREKYLNIGRNVKGIDILKFLMEEHGLRQTDLKKELGGQSVVSELLSGKRRRKLNRNQIEALAKKFHVSPSVFFDKE